MPELIFHGAAGEVTGSMHLIRLDGQYVALDCGLFQGHRAETEEKNRTMPLPPEQLAAVILTHAHTDHAGRLPCLTRAGFDGPIYCTPATRDLCALTLPDSAHIQQEDTFYINKKRRRRNLPPVEPLYDVRDAHASVRQMQTVAYGRWFSPLPGLLACFQDAGHMLGSAGVHLAFGQRDGSAPTLYFTGDLGSPNKPILRDPAPLPPTDVLICESTYGGRVNESVADAKQIMLEAVKRTFARGGKVIIPAFSVGRTQTMVYFLNQLMTHGDLPAYPVFVDSPLAVGATDVFRMHPDCYDEEALQFQKKAGDILGEGRVKYIRDVEESMRLHRRRTPCAIISASGMCETGRIQHHIKNNISNPKNLLLIPGYQAENTLGRRLADGAREIRLFHEDYPVRAEVIQIHGFSGHADQNEILSYVTPLRGQTRRVFLVHGEQAQSAALREKLRAAGLDEVNVAQRGARVEF